MTDITIFHNPKCGTSRNTLARIRQSGIEPTVIEYLKTPPSREPVSYTHLDVYKRQATVMTSATEGGAPVRPRLRTKPLPYTPVSAGSVAT